jgi:hypothetical protein
MIAMKYMLLIYQNPITWQGMTEDERTAIMQEVEPIFEELSVSGEWVGGEGLVAPALTKTVRTRDGVPAVTDGPFLEAKEQLAGYLIVDVKDEERAIDIAARWPDAKRWAMEVRQVMG